MLEIVRREVDPAGVCVRVCLRRATDRGAWTSSTPVCCLSPMLAGDNKLVLGGTRFFSLKFKMFVDGTVRGTTCMPQLWRRWELLIACRRTVHMPAVRSDLNVRRQVSKRGAVKRAVNRAVSGRCADEKPTQACLIHCTTDSTLVGVAKRKKQRGRSAADASTRSTALASRN